MKNNTHIATPKISISVCTRKRPKMLSRLLDSMASMAYPEGVDVSIDIFENNTAKSLTGLIEKISKDIPVSVNHHLEKKYGIPIVRNTALKVAKNADASHIIFIDDDERVDQFWLVNLWDYYLQCEDNTVVQGAVISTIETTKNCHLHSHFQRPMRSTGDILETCATNNVLIKLSVFVDHNLKFDETRPLAGGTDSKLFHKARKCGIPLHYCAEAIVYEDVPEERVSLRWLGKRNFRIGLTVGKRKKSEGEGLEYPLSHTLKTFRLLARSLPHPIRRKRKKQHERWLLAWRCAGKVLGYFNVTIDYYKKIDGE